MERFWGDLVDQVAFVKYNPWENTYQRSLNDIAAPCSDLWRRMFVWWDGTVNPCDVDYLSTLAVGDANSEHLSEIWNGDKYNALRKAHLARRRNSITPCMRCTLV
jgi:radical SAM protein with 4Fe4S-binding SPASM domain